MITELYICKRGSEAGEIRRLHTPCNPSELSTDMWQLYADFEREKLKELGGTEFRFWWSIPKRNKKLCPDSRTPAYFWESGDYRGTWNSNIISYSADDYMADSESSRLLKRAEFLKAVCQREGVEWLPQENPDSCNRCACGEICTLMGKCPTGKCEAMQKVLQQIINANMAPSYAMKDGPPQEATEYSKVIAESALTATNSHRCLICGQCGLHLCPGASASEAVHSPRHYTSQVPGIECIDVVQHFNFARGNAIKYLWRCGEKGPPIEDLKKAIKYCEFEIQRLTNEAIRAVKNRTPAISITPTPTDER